MSKKARVHRGQVWKSISGSPMRIIVGTDPEMYAFSTLTFEMSPAHPLSAEALYRYLYEGVFFDSSGNEIPGREHERFAPLQQPAFKSAILAIIKQGAQDAGIGQNMYDKWQHMMVTSGFDVPAPDHYKAIADDNISGVHLVQLLRRLHPGIVRETLQKGGDMSVMEEKYEAVEEAMYALATELEGIDHGDMLANLAGSGLATFSSALSELWVNEYKEPVLEPIRGDMNYYSGPYDSGE